MAKRPSRTLRKVKGRKLNASRYSKLFKPTQRLRRLTIVWADTNGDPYDTTGFYATVTTTSGRLVQSARFDSYGVVVFSRIHTPTSRDYIVRTYYRDGTQYREVTVPADNAAYVIIP